MSLASAGKRNFWTILYVCVSYIYIFLDASLRFRLAEHCTFYLFIISARSTYRRCRAFGEGGRRQRHVDRWEFIKTLNVKISNVLAGKAFTRISAPRHGGGPASLKRGAAFVENCWRRHFNLDSRYRHQTLRFNYVHCLKFSSFRIATILLHSLDLIALCSFLESEEL